MTLYVETGPDGHLYPKPRFMGREVMINLSCSPARLISSSDFSPPSCAPVHGARDFSSDTHPNEAADGHGLGPILTRAVQACSGSPAERRADDGRNRVFAGHALPVRGVADVGCEVAGSSPAPGFVGGRPIDWKGVTNRPRTVRTDESNPVTLQRGLYHASSRSPAPLRDRAAARVAHNHEVGGASPPPAILDPTTEAQRTQRAHESNGLGLNPAPQLRGPRISLSASVVNESRSHEAAITPGAVAHARRRVLPDAVAVLIRIGWMVLGAAAWAAVEIT